MLNPNVLPGVTKLDWRMVSGGDAVARLPKSSQPIMTWPGWVALLGLIASCGCSVPLRSELPPRLTVFTPLNAKDASFDTPGEEIGVPATISALFGLNVGPVGKPAGVTSMLAQAIYTLLINGSSGNTRRRSGHRAGERARIDSQGGICRRVGARNPLVNVLLAEKPGVLPAKLSS